MSPALSQRHAGAHRAKSALDFDAINQAVRVSFHAVLVRILPDGKTIGGEYVARNPRRVDHRLGSFKVNLRTGRWADFATGDRGGDPISLVAYLENISQGEAALLLAQMTGLGGGRND
jgi:hypothetical protein